MGLARFFRRGTSVSLEAYETIEAQVEAAGEYAAIRINRIRELEAYLGDRNREVGILRGEVERLEGRLNRTLARYEGIHSRANDIASELGASDAKREYILGAIAKYLKVPAGKKGYAAARKKLAELV